MDTAILARVEDFCIREGLLQPGASQHLAAAVSGGADSMALLLLLRQLQPRFGYTLSACHVNHGLRGQSADRDEAFVRAECARLGVPLRVFHAAELTPPPAHAGEDWARRLRYTAFVQLQGQGIDAIATAHTANDQAETLLLRLARGTGLYGAGGIRPRRGCYLRPLLCLSRAETEAVCRAAGQTWVTDETNDTDAYARNRLRHHAMPAIEAAFAQSDEVLIEECIAGREMGCGMMVAGGREYLFPITEIVSKKDFFDYQAKYTEGYSDEITPADIAPEIAEELHRMTRIAYRACRCSGVVRVDFIVTPEGKPYLIEINSIPGMSAGSIVPKQARAMGMSLGEMFDLIIADTCRK